jgi:hypothetical protein
MWINILKKVSLKNMKKIAHIPLNTTNTAYLFLEYKYKMLKTNKINNY